MKSLLLQLAIGWHRQLTDITYGHHSKLCSKYGYDFHVITERTNKSRGVYWEKVLGIRDAIQDYDYVFYLDADTLWLGGELFRPETAIAATIHTDPMIHYNAGVLYVNSAMASEAIEAWLSTDDDNHIWQDQYALYKILQSHPQYVTQVGPEWNTLAYTDYSHTPKVLAWHGRNDLAKEGILRAIDRN